MSNPAFLRPAVSKLGINYIACGPQRSQFTVVCVHGWACRASDYTYLFKELSNLGLNFQCIAVSLPGHGKSSTASYLVAGIPTFARATVDLVNELDISNVVFVGHSMGVRVALEACIQSASTGKPDVKGLVFLDGSHYKFRKSLFPFDKADPRSRNLSPEQRKAKMAEGFKGMFSSRTPREFQESTVAHVMEVDIEYNETMRASHINYDHEFYDDALEQFGKSGLPLLNLQATYIDDQNRRVAIKPEEGSRWMSLLQEKVPQTKQIIIQDANHFPHVDQAEKVAERMMEFLTRLQAVEGRL